MHNCKTKREQIIEVLLNHNGGPPAQLPDCPDCRHEFTEVRETLRVTRRQLESVVPSDEYFKSYHERLAHRLDQNEITDIRSSVTTPQLGWIPPALTASVRLPISLVALLLAAFAVSLFAVHKLSLSDPAAPQLSIVHVPVEVPVVQEKVVTKVVYRKQKSKTPRANLNLSDSTLAKSQTQPSLVGFKPLDEVKMTVIKGGSPDEK